MILGGSVEEYLSEKEQWEWIKAQVRENGPAVILAIAVVVAAVSGWRWWQGHLDAGRLEAGAKYTQMVQALDGGDRSRALALFGELQREYAASPYTDQARLLAARRPFPRQGPAVRKRGRRSIRLGDLDCPGAIKWGHLGDAPRIAPQHQIADWHAAGIEPHHERRDRPRRHERP